MARTFPALQRLALTALEHEDQLEEYFYLRLSTALLATSVLAVVTPMPEPDSRAEFAVDVESDHDDDELDPDRAHDARKNGDFS